MILSNGISGFNAKEEASLLKVDRKEFKSICYCISTTLSNGKLVEIREHSSAANFYQASFSIQDTVTHVLLNAHYPIIAIASHVAPFSIAFIDSPQLSKEFSKYYTVICSNELNEPLRYSGGGFLLDNDNELDISEIEQVRYWKPKTVGEIAFNFWD